MISRKLYSKKIFVDQYVTFTDLHKKLFCGRNDDQGQDIYSAIDTAHLCEKQENDKWKVTGQDLDNEELTLIIAIDGMNVIVTLY